MQRNVQNNFEGEKNIKKLRNREILKREEKLVNFKKKQHRKICIYENFEKKWINFKEGMEYKEISIYDEKLRNFEEKVIIE